jgi:hypothetical protein
VSAPAVDNRTEFAVHPQLRFGKRGEELLTVVKGTWVLPRGADALEVGDEQRPVRFVDEPWGDPASTPPKYPCDIVGNKLGTDVIVVAKGCVPSEAPSFDVVVRVGPLTKALRIFGLRVWLEDGGGLSAPRPVREQEIRYDAAWGGLDASDPTSIVEEARNPAGLGVTRDKSLLTHARAPCIEDPANPIRVAIGKHVPAGFGPLAPNWEPRRRYHGTYDDAWLRDHAPLMPADHDERANSCASPGLHAQPALVGGESVALLNLIPGGGALEFELPRVALDIEVKNGKGDAQRFTPSLDTVVIDTLHVPGDALVTVELVWRVLGRAPRRMQDATVCVSARGDGA